MLAVEDNRVRSVSIMAAGQVFEYSQCIYIKLTNDVNQCAVFNVTQACIETLAGSERVLGIEYATLVIE